MRRRVITATVVLGLLVIGLGVGFAYSTWGRVNRVTIDRQQEPAGVAALEPGEEEQVEPDAVDLNEEIFLLVGSDSRDQLTDLEGFGAFEGRRADVVMVLIATPSGTALLSLPRDLLVTEPCRDSETRLNALLEGCVGIMNGPTLLLRTVEDLIGERVDHYAMVDFAGFQEVVDVVGGYEICVDRPVRDRRASLSLPAGCTLADGAQTLAWLRSRHTQELTEGGWEIMPGMNDLVRNERQRAFLIDMMSRLSDFSSPQALAASANALAPHITVDQELTLGDAVDLAWIMRGLERGDITELEVPVYDHVTEDGASVLLPSVRVDKLVADFLDGHVVAAGAPGVAMGTVRA